MTALAEAQGGMAAGQSAWTASRKCQQTPRSYRDEPIAPPGEVLNRFAAGFADGVNCIWRGRRLGEYLGADIGRRQIWHACLASGHADFAPVAQDVAGCERAYEDMTFLRGKSLLTRAFGACPPGFIGALRRMGETASPREAYRSLAAVLASGEPGVREVLRCRRINAPTIAVLAYVCASPHAAALLALLRRNSRNAADVAALRWVVERLEQIEGPDIAAQIFAAADPVQAAQTMWRELPFAPPPWAGDERMRPVTCLRELAEVGRRFANCLRNRLQMGRFVGSFRNGSECLYEWRGDEPGLLHFAAAQPLGWVLQQMVGFKNMPLADSTKREIAVSLQAVPHLCIGPFADRLDSWTCGESALLEDMETRPEAADADCV